MATIQDIEKQHAANNILIARLKRTVQDFTDYTIADFQKALESSHKELDENNDLLRTMLPADHELNA